MSLTAERLKRVDREMKERASNQPPPPAVLSGEVVQLQTAVADIVKAKQTLDDESSAACERVREALELYGTSSEEVVWRACWTISFLCSSSSSNAFMCRTEFGRIGVCALIVDAMKKYASSEAVCIWACYAIGALALRHEDNKLLLTSAGAVPCITAISSNNALSTGARQEAIKALVAMNEEYRARTAELGSSTSRSSTKESKSKHAVSHSQGRVFAAKHGDISFFEVSALSGENVAEAFAALAFVANLPDTGKVKVLLAGDSQVGKSCLLEQYTSNSFTENIQPTIGVDFKMVDDYVVGGESKRLELWDSSGDEKYRLIARSYYRGVSGVMLVYDVNNRASFDALEEQIEHIKGVKPTMKFVLVGNKCDL